jgi:dipeptidyl aminopeptidase/acylaminoacyl peptidase
VDAALAQPSFQPFAPVTLSPDGRWVAYTLKYANRAISRSAIDTWYTRTGVASTALGTRVRITELATGRTLVVGDDSATSWAPSWSPDGRYLAFYSDADGVAHLWVRETTTGRTHRVGNAIVRANRAIQYPRWTPDSRTIVMPALPAGTSLPEALSHSVEASDDARRGERPTVTVLRADPKYPYGGRATSGQGTAGSEALRADLVRVDVRTGGMTMLASGYWPLEFRISPDGQWLAFTSEHAPILAPRWFVPYDVMLIPLDGPRREPRTIATNVAITNYSEGLFWSPTKAVLLYSATDTAGRDRYYSVTPGEWQPRQVAVSSSPRSATDSMPSGSRAFWWDEDGSAFYIVRRHHILVVSMPDGVVRSELLVPSGYSPLSLVGAQWNASARTEGGRSLIVAVREDSTKRMGFARLEMGSGAFRLLESADRRYGERRDLPIDITRDGRIVFRSEDARHPPELWTTTRDFTAMAQLTHVAKALESTAFGTARLIDFVIPDGERRRATLLLPTGYREGKRYPLVVYPYPVDDRSNDVNVFGVTGSGTENMQLLATRGIAVLTPDIAPFQWTDEMRQLTSIILASVDRVVEMGIADSTRLGIMGHSWGGYTTIAVITQTPRFSAAVMRAGLADQVAMTGALKQSGFGYGVQLQEMTLGGTIWQRPDVYLKNSPIYELKHVRTPLLIVHGEGDTTVPVFLADQLFANLQRLGKEVEFARYDNENHNEALWSSANQRDYAMRMLDWFTAHLVANSSERNAETATPRSSTDPAGGTGSVPR